MEKYAINPKYKDGLFRMLFSEKKELLSLYNAVRGAQYTNEDDLVVNTLAGVIYLGIKNDISFVIGGELSLYEHQSTCCGNIPLRNLLYVSDLYAGIIAKENIFGSKTLQLPRPRFVVFYNGIKDMPDRSVQKLSDAYQRISPGLARSEVDTERDIAEIEELAKLRELNELVELELIVTILNINKGHNEELMSKCKSLREYVIYVDKVRCYSKSMSAPTAIERAIEECIKDEVLADYLRKHREEVKHVSIYEFDQELYDEGLREDGREQGLEQGIQKSVEMAREFGIEEEELMVQLIQKFKLSKEKALEYLKTKGVNI